MGSSRGKVVRTGSNSGEATASKLANLVGGSPSTPGRAVASPNVERGETSQGLGYARATVRRLIKEDLGRKSLRQLTARRVKPVKADHRLSIFRTWKSQI